MACACREALQVGVPLVSGHTKIAPFGAGTLLLLTCKEATVLRTYWQAEKSADDSVVRQVMEAVGSGCSEATARRLLAACGNDSNKAARLANQALEALHKSWDQIDADASRPRGAVLSPFSQVCASVCVSS